MPYEVRTFLPWLGQEPSPDQLTQQPTHVGCFIIELKLIEFEVQDWGRKPYDEGVLLQRELLEEVLAGARGHTLVLVEHDPVLTLGADFHAENLLHPVEFYGERGIAVHRTDRGGDVTYHGPGQLVIYPIFNVALLGKDLHKWMRNLEQAVICALLEERISGVRLPVNSGVWVGENKICAIGIKIRRWVSMHGLALNCDVDFSAFEMIVPCGVRGHGVTSISRELGRAVSVDVMKPAVVRGFHSVFDPLVTEGA